MAELNLGRLLDTWRARLELRGARRQHPELQALRLDRAMLVKPGRCVFAGRLGAQPVVAKLIRDPEKAAQDTAAAMEELRIAWARMSTGPHQVPEPIFAAPQSGLLVMARAPGKKLTDVIRRAPPDRGAALLSHAADWLATFTAERRRSVAFASEFWTAQRAARHADLDDEDLRRLAGHLTVSLKMQAARLHHLTVTQVRPHGDFWSHNLIWDGAVLTGIDIQHRTWQPLARDPARLLTHISAILPHPEGPFRYGLPARWVEAVEKSPLLAEEPPGLLRFFVGIELSHRLTTEHRFERTRASTRANLERYLATPD